LKLSIITVCYNSAATIRDTIESVLSQDYADIEYIVVDGGSKDGTQAIVESYGRRISTFVSEPDKGIYDAMNKGVMLATGDVVGILNSDDFYEGPRVISSVVEAFQSRPDSDVVFGDVVFVNAPDLQKITRFYRGNRFAPWKLRFGWMPPHPASFIRRTAYQRVGSYSLKYKISADYEFFCPTLPDSPPQIRVSESGIGPHALGRSQYGWPEEQPEIESGNSERLPKQRCVHQSVYVALEVAVQTLRVA